MQPYIVPVHFAYHNNCLYGFSMLGQKIEWMRANPLVCVESDHMSGEQWTTVLVFGRYEELSDTAEMQSELELALGLLQERAAWWQPGSVKIAQGDTLPTLAPVFYRIKIVQITGRCATFGTGGG
jgi:nitroimidazol reductase NimA-like FMN-containing flavoprotein (pyridoxamine 5'-phosphate oxidase superfamily)